MTLTRLEKIAFLACAVLVVLGIGTIILRRSSFVRHNEVVAAKIREIRDLTPKVPLEKSEDAALEEDAGDAGKLNVNFLTVAQLDALPKVGKTTAERIAAFVKERGGINSLQDLLEVQGISKSKLRFLSRYLTAKGGNRDPQALGGKLNLNFADVKAVQNLPGVGQKLAAQIIDFRNKNGGLFSLEDLMEVPGMTAGKLAKFRDLVEVR